MLQKLRLDVLIEKGKEKKGREGRKNKIDLFIFFFYLNVINTRNSYMQNIFRVISGKKFLRKM